MAKKRSGGQRSGGGARRGGGGSSRRYPRTARLNELVREIVAEELERIDDERLGLLTITAVEVDAGIEHAKIHWTDLGADDELVLEVLEEHRPRLQRAVNRQTHMRRTPVLSFHADEVLRGAQRIEDILRGLDAGAPDTPGSSPGDGDVGMPATELDEPDPPQASQE